MKLAFVFVPFGVALAVAGGLMYYASQRSEPREKLYIAGEVRHPVSKEMEAEAKAMAKKTAPFFKVKDAHDIEVQIGGEGKKPQFVYFILEGCPCSLDVQPFYNKLYQRYKDKVDFIGVISSSREKALDFAGQTTLLHPIVSDPDKKIIKAYGVKQSTYSVLILPTGMVDTMWPGYSSGMLKELNSDLAKLSKAKEVPFDTMYAPKQITSGCFF